jgi:hypothetical protein
VAGIGCINPIAPLGLRAVRSPAEFGEDRRFHRQRIEPMAPGAGQDEVRDGAGCGGPGARLKGGGFALAGELGGARQGNRAMG